MKLAAAGATTSVDDIVIALGPAMLYGLAIACAIPVVGDPREPRARALAATMARRALEGARDHGSFTPAS